MYTDRQETASMDDAHLQNDLKIMLYPLRWRSHELGFYCTSVNVQDSACRQGCAAASQQLFAVGFAVLRK